MDLGSRLISQKARTAAPLVAAGRANGGAGSTVSEESKRLWEGVRQVGGCVGSDVVVVLLGMPKEARAPGKQHRRSRCSKLQLRSDQERQ